MAEYYDMKDKMRRSAQDEQTARFKAATGNDPYAAEIIAGESRVAAPPAAPSAPKGRVRGVPSEMTAERYAPIKSAAPEGKTQRTVPVGPQPVVANKPDMFPAYGYEAPLTKMFRDNGMSEADATQVAKNIIEVYKQSGDKSTGQLMKYVADTQTKSKFTPNERERNLRILFTLMSGALTGGGVSAIGGTAADVAALGGSGALGGSSILAYPYANKKK